MSGTPSQNAQPRPNPPETGWQATKRRLARLRRDENGSTGLETVLIMATFGLPAFLIIRLGLNLLIAHYQMITDLNALPIP